MLSICKAYHLKVYSHKNKEYINNKLVKTILQRKSMTVECQTQSITTTSTHGTSGTNVPVFSNAYLTDAAGPSGISNTHASKSVAEATVSVAEATGSVTVAEAEAWSDAGATGSVADSVVSVPVPAVQRKRIIQGKGKGKGKRKRKIRAKVAEDESHDSCEICNVSYKEGENWICYDFCSLWFHQECVHIDEDDWTSFTEDGQPYLCPLCQ